MSGAAVADVGGVGRLCLNAMTKEGFDEEFSAAVTGASAVIGPIIPPSVPMIIFAMVTDVSIGKLFLGGVIPGFIMALSLMIYIYFVSKKRNYPVGQRLNLRKLRQALGRGFLPLLTPVILLGSIYGGFCTVTEAAALAVLYSLLLGGFVYRRLGFQSLFNVLRKVFISIGPILIIFAAAKIFGYVLTTEKVPDLFAQIVLQFAAHPFMVILLINVLFLILGCFSDPNVNIILFVPIVFPLVQMTQMDPIHFGVMVVLNAMIGLNTPPMGQLLITLKGFVDISYEQIIKAMWPFILILLLDLLLIILIPATTTYLPNLFFK
jgi:tripartite ATP-independent transporter DctM subunit